MKRRIRIGLSLLLTGLISVASGCGSNQSVGSAVSTETEIDSEVSVEEATEAETETTGDLDPNRTGAKWIDSGLYGTFEGMDEIRLQDDFAAYINRDWAENVEIPDGASNASSRTELSRENDEKKMALLNEEVKDDPELIAMQNFNTLLMDWDTRNNQGMQELKPYIEDIQSISSISDLTAYYSDPERNLLGSAMIQFSIAPNQYDALHNLIYLESPMLFAGGESFFEEDNEYRQNIEDLVTYALEKTGYSEEDAKKTFDAAVAFEEGFMPSLMSFYEEQAEKGDSVLYNVYSAEDLDHLCSNIPVREIFKGLGYRVDGPFNVNIAEMLQYYDSVYTQDNLEAMKNWIIAHTAYEMMAYFDRESYEKKQSVENSYIGVDTLPPDKEYALNTIYGLIPGEIDKLFAEYCFNQEIKPQVAELVDLMMDYYREMLQTEDWLSSETRDAAIEKLNTMKLHICYPDELPDYSSLKIRSASEGGTVFEAVRAVKAFNAKSSNERLSIVNDGTLWGPDEHYSSLGAAYISSENSINIYAGICGGDYYNPDWPIEKKLGGLSFVVGHELTHAFDTDGSMYDKDGNYRDWWTAEDREAFDERRDKLVRYYSTLVPAPQISDEPYGEDGAKHIMAEAIADLGSMKCICSIADSMEDFDYELFFHQLGLIQKNARYEKAEIAYISTNVHPVECYRCNIPIQNQQQFLDTFGIKEGDGMYLAPEDRIGIW